MELLPPRGREGGCKLTQAFAPELCREEQPGGGSQMRIDCQKTARGGSQMRIHCPESSPGSRLASGDPAPRTGPDTSGASPGYRPLGAQRGMSGISERRRGVVTSVGGYPDPGHKSTATPAAASPLRRELPGREADTARCRDCLRSSPVADRTHLSVPTPHTPLSHPPASGQNRLLR